MITEDELSDVKAKYELMEILGEGAFGVDVTSLQREIELLKEVHHPHIIELYDVYENEQYLHLVTELCTGGELYDKVIDLSESEQGHFEEDDAACLIRDILDAIHYIHDELNIVHRDLKPENFLLSDDTEEALVKIIDFGLSRRDDAPFGVMTSRVGTPYYVAPEVLYESYTFKCDIWSVGVITYIVLCGFAPFAGESDLETLNLVKFGALEFPSPEWDTISEDAKDFVRQLLARDPLARPTAAKALQHPWVAKHISEPGIPVPRPFSLSKARSPSDRRISSSSGRAVSASTALRLDSTRATAFQKFLSATKMKKAMARASIVLTPKEARHLGEVFQRVDQDRDGRITISDLEGALGAKSFSSSVKQNLKQMKTHLLKHPSVTFDVRPFMPFVDERAKSDSTDKKI